MKRDKKEKVLVRYTFASIKEYRKHEDAVRELAENTGASMVVKMS